MTERPGVAGAIHKIYVREVEEPATTLHYRINGQPGEITGPRRTAPPVTMPPVSPEDRKELTDLQRLEQIQALQLQLHGRVWRITN